jgi:rare lipoprotein A
MMRFDKVLSEMTFPSFAQRSTIVRPGRLGLVAAAALVLTACARPAQISAPAPPPQPMPPVAQAVAIDPKLGVAPSPRVAIGPALLPRGGGVYKIGKPYQIAGRWYVPREDAGYQHSGTASWYGTQFHGRKTANGEIFDMNALTAAHPTLPLPSYLLVTNLDNNRTLLVRVNDRGPYVPGRIVDLSRQAARELDLERRGTGMVHIRYAGRAPLDGDDSRELSHLAAQSWARTMTASATAQRAPASVALPVPAYGLRGSVDSRAGWAQPPSLGR